MIARIRTVASDRPPARRADPAVTARGVASRPAATVAARCVASRPAATVALRCAVLSLAGLASFSVRAEATPELDYLFVVTSDYSVSGQVSTVDVLAPWSVDANLASVHSDAIAREHGGLVYIVNRLYQDNIQVLDPSQGFATVRQFSVGPGSNPQDIAFASPTRAYVSRYEETSLYEVDPTTGTVTDSIDLSAFADADGIPEMGQMAVWGDLLFVAVQRLDRDYYWIPEPPSYLVVIDTNTNELVDADPDEPGVQGITLGATNPSTEILVDGDVLYVGAAGNWGVLDGGIEAVDPSALASLGLVATEQGLGGEINDFTLPVDGRAYAVVSVSSPSWEAFCVSFDWVSGEKLQDVWRPGGFDVTDVEVHAGAGELFVSDRTYTNPGVRVFDVTDDSQLTSSPLNVGLPPHDLVVIGDAIVGIPEGAAASGSRLALAVSPNPCRGPADIELAMPAPGRLSLGVYDVAGRRVAEIFDGALPAGRTRVRWEGSDALGHAVASGVYFVRALFDGRAETAKLLVLR